METIRSIKGNVHLFLIDLCINIIKRKKKSIPLFYVSPIPHLVLRCFFPGLLKICVLHDVCVSSKYFIYDTVRQKKRKIKIVMWILHCFRELRCTFYILFTIVYTFDGCYVTSFEIMPLMSVWIEFVTVMVCFVMTGNSTKKSCLCWFETNWM